MCNGRRGRFSWPAVNKGDSVVRRIATVIVVAALLPWGVSAGGAQAVGELTISGVIEPSSSMGLRQTSLRFCSPVSGVDCTWFSIDNSGGFEGVVAPGEWLV